MAEGFEHYHHVPQQSRRDKLREIDQDASGLFHLYDPSLLPNPDFLSYAAAAAGHDFYHQLGGACRPASVKEEDESLAMMGYVGNNGGGNIVSPSSSHHHPHYLDLQSPIPINPFPIPEINSSPFLYSSQSLDHHPLQNHHPSLNNGSGLLVFKPPSEPILSLTHHGSNITSATGQGLSLSLNLQDSSASPIFNDINGFRGAPSSDIASRDSVSIFAPLGPFTGYASILKGSRFLRPAQQLLDEFCEVGRGIYAQKVAAAAAAGDSPMESGIDEMGVEGIGCCGGDGGEQGRKKPRLIAMLDEV